jgi:penicillin-binding protein 1C
LEERDDLTNGEESRDEEPAEDRLDRLMGAKKRTEEEAARWEEIENRGLPVPSHDRADTAEPRPDDSEEERERTETEPIPPSPPQYPHPTDRGVFTEPPVAEEPPSPGVEPLGGQPHHRWQEPHVDAGHVRVDENGMPLPARSPRREVRRYEADDYASAELPDTEPHRPIQPSAPPPVSPPTQPSPMYIHTVAPPPAPSREARRPHRRRLSWGCVFRTMLLLFAAVVVLGMIGGGGIAVWYVDVISEKFGPGEGQVDSVDDLQAQALQFETARIRDREGNILYEINDPTGGFRDYVTLDEISPWVIHATIATEERNFYSNPGFSLWDIARAMLQNVRSREVVSGASTITQQLTRALLMDPEERTERSYGRKIREIFLAAEMGRRFDKNEILELYLNQIYYGNLAYGIEAAAQTYFGIHASELTLAQASFLAGLPQSPAVYDPVLNPEAAFARQLDVISLMVEAGCIETESQYSTICITQEDLNVAAAEIAEMHNIEFEAPAISARFPHWSVYVRQLLEADEDWGPSLFTSGYDVYTTLDPRLQELAEQQVEEQIALLTDRNVTNASVVIIDPHTGAILAMVGSRDFNDEDIDGQVNIPLTLQQPGSSIKPFTYIAAFRQGWTPATVIWDVPIEYQIPGFGVYAPVNYDGAFHGPVPVRSALANSYNVPAVIALDYVGVPALLEVLNDVGITSLGDSSNPNNYGLSLTLGAGEVYPLEWTNAFATIASGGVYHPPYAIERIEVNGQPIWEYEVPPGEQVIDPDHAYLIASILSDHDARTPAFGTNSILTAPYPAAAKTGTTNDYRDNWTMGFTTELVVGVWVGNTDNSPMLNVSGVTGAGPIWRYIMDGAQEWYPAQPFPRPTTVFEQTVCRDDGALPSSYCLEHSSTRTELFSINQEPPDASDGLYRQLRIDRFTGLIANDYCPNYTDEVFFVDLPDYSQLIDLPAFEQAWLTSTADGQGWASQRALALDRFGSPPDGECGPDTPIPAIFISSPATGEEVQGTVEVRGTANAPNFAYYILDYGLSANPIGWGTVTGQVFAPVENGLLGALDVRGMDNGPITLRLTVFDQAGHQADIRVTVTVHNPAPTARPTAMPTATATTAPATATSTPTEQPPLAATETPIPTVTPTPTETPTPPETPP